MLNLPFESELRAERFRLLDTLEGLTGDEFNTGRTLCVGWAPRDVLGHLIGVDRLVQSYLPHGPCVNAANQAHVDWARRLPPEELIRMARDWAAAPALTSRLCAVIVLGDLAIHHQDIVRGLGRTRDIPGPIATSIYRDGLMLSLLLNRRALRFSPVPTDSLLLSALPRLPGLPKVYGTREALGMWLAGRDTVKSELWFP
ncbi:maleylpyruvate isomerase family mycothiol-dependent enzyme [Streptomyces sp. ISL-11]|uniref:maleylpyruvate isomerase family mycothiol-dependent enzyme n=1 Tax=Streptomyces sp. ISL-11 TaxID=2819174 RepID=UPI001BECB60C|nr:maleylpyruvate isomerase family mycothiol-dependent enzyme [Streptomyces sp. ISL-11]MBT2385289.1 maleylpyruvate isomerase family mycothiol-dependent enzyme [Streptomyces sp. ISL-11]